MIDINNLPEWLIERPGERFPHGFVACAIKASKTEQVIPVISVKEQQGLK